MSLSDPLVSIIIPVYNGANYLKQSIESALSQTYSNKEVIVVNDGSNDDNATENIVNNYKYKVRYYYKDNGGVASALNYGIKQMKGTWFSWLSHDDLYLPTKIEKQVQILHNVCNGKNDVIISCKTGLIDTNGESLFYPKKFPEGLYSGDQVFNKLFQGDNLSGCSLLIPKKALTEVDYFDERYRYIQDWGCWVKMALNGYHFFFHKDELVLSRIHPDQDTLKLANLRPNEINMFLADIFEYLKEQNKHQYIKDIYYSYYWNFQKSSIKRQIKVFVKEKSLFSILDIFRYFPKLFCGMFRYFIKVIFRKYKIITAKGKL